MRTNKKSRDKRIFAHILLPTDQLSTSFIAQIKNEEKDVCTCDNFAHTHYTHNIIANRSIAYKLYSVQKRLFFRKTLCFDLIKFCKSVPLG